MPSQHTQLIPIKWDEAYNDGEGKEINKTKKKKHRNKKTVNRMKENKRTETINSLCIRETHQNDRMAKLLLVIRA